MEGGSLPPRLLVSKLCFVVVLLLLLSAPSLFVLLMLDGSPVLENLSLTPEQLKALYQGLLQQQQEEEHEIHGTEGHSDCNYAKGSWVADERRPLYSGDGCKQWLSAIWSCRGTERAGFSHESYRWQPDGCDIPELSGPNFLNRMRHKTLGFVGDSLAMEQFQSMMCIATAGGGSGEEVEDVGWRYGVAARAPGALRSDGAYRFPRTNTTLLFHWSSHLAEMEALNATAPTSYRYALHLDRPAPFLKKHLGSFDALVINTGHHWHRRELARNRVELYAGGDPVGRGGPAAVDLGRARSMKLRSITGWLDSELARSPGTKVFLRTMSPRHPVVVTSGGGGAGNAGESCGSEVRRRDHSGDLAAELAVSGTRVKLLGITSMSQLRADGHISNHSLGGRRSSYDCLHWCLPGIPDTWNELLFAQI